MEDGIAGEWALFGHGHEHRSGIGLEKHRNYITANQESPGQRGQSRSLQPHETTLSIFLPVWNWHINCPRELS